ncbi:MAG: Gfo/Idh/MocA family protein [Actinomycetota bacterium]
MIRIAVIGAGHWGPNLIRNFNNGRTSSVVRVVDRDEKRLAQVHQRFNDIQTSSNAADAFNDAGVDAVVIATPTSTHFELVKAALEAGKHVLVEKPIAHDVESSDALVELATNVGRTLMVGHVFLFNGAVREAARIIDNGDLGKIFHISMVRTNLGPIRMDVDASWDLAAHDISVANYLLKNQALTASAVGGDWINKGIADAVFATLRYPNNVLVNLHVSWLNPRKVRDVTIVGEQMMLTIDDMNMNEPVRIYDKGIRDDISTPGWADTFGSFRSSVREGNITVPRVALGEPLLAECEHFIECVSTGSTPIASGQVGADVVRTLAAITRSMSLNGAEVEVGK